MAILKCKMCGGDLEITEGMTVAECEYCGSKQTIPAADNEKKLTLFARANRLRFACEFDKAAGVYEALVADFPEESEAYWGLVLCKYGIEYVDDPTTGKKIPTCHRSSFDSVLDDSNLEQAMENADVAARKLYREEAKQIEELRKGIIEVSGKEEPYDIFICYKETGENGDRTLDSVLAQDVHDALTDKGYRVFFSRITLEDKLGQEYEPYIFAALNSAKIMLAFGTDYEYFNAVWVKNEWSRYLQLMTQDKSRHLIPCYKGIDAYDMPKEFAKLQAQDMGKVGAVQDLLRGIEKLLPRQEKTHVIQQVMQTVNSNLDAILKRGNMALEDGDWNGAGGFFDRVLDLDAECAQAYLGKVLVTYRTANLTSWVEKLDASQVSVGTTTLSAGQPDQVAEEKILRDYLLLPYLQEGEIRNALKFSFSYHSQTSGWEKRKCEMVSNLQNNRNLIRAEQYAQGALKSQISGAISRIVGSYSGKIQQAKEDDETAVTSIQKEYAHHLSELTSLKQLRFCAEEAREKDYTIALQIFRQEDYAGAKELFRKTAQTGYRDSLEMVKSCDQRIAEKAAADKAEKARKAAAEKAEEERKEAIHMREEAARAKKNRTIAAVCVVAVILAIATFVAVTKVIIPRNQYKEAEALLAAEQYEEAMTIFEELGTYQDSQQKLVLLCLRQSLSLQNANDTENAAKAYEQGQIWIRQLEDPVYRHLESEIQDLCYRYAQALVLQKEYDHAIPVLTELGSYGDSEQLQEKAQYGHGVNLLAEDQIAQAIDQFRTLGMVKEVTFLEALRDAAMKEYESAEAKLKTLSGENSFTNEFNAEVMKRIEALIHMNEIDVERNKACRQLLLALGDYPGASEMAACFVERMVSYSSDSTTYLYAYNEKGQIFEQYDQIRNLRIWYKNEYQADGTVFQIAQTGTGGTYHLVYKRNEQGQVISKVESFIYEDGREKENSRIYFTYNSDGTLAKATKENNVGAYDSHYTYSRNADGQIDGYRLETESSDGRKLTYEFDLAFDENGRLLICGNDEQWQGSFEYGYVFIQDENQTYPAYSDLNTHLLLHYN